MLESSYVLSVMFYTSCSLDLYPRHTAHGAHLHFLAAASVFLHNNTTHTQTLCERENETCGVQLGFFRERGVPLKILPRLLMVRAIN